MSIRFRISVRCDSPLCGRDQAALMPQAETVALELAQLELDLRRDGWTSSGDKDYCPSHARLGKRPINISTAAGPEAPAGPRTSPAAVVHSRRPR